MKSKTNLKEKITKEMMEQYERIRSLGPCNVFDYHCVVRAATELEFYDLAELGKDEYITILTNFDELMKKFGIKLT